MDDRNMPQWYPWPVFWIEHDGKFTTVHTFVYSKHNDRWHSSAPYMQDKLCQYAR